MSELFELNPQRVFFYFNEITKIPRPSYKEKAISDYLAEFGRKIGLETYQDKLGNVIIKKPASEGMEEVPAIVLQGHMDMVCVSVDPSIDWNQDAVKAYIDGDYVRAKDTSLGADDGIAIAMMLAVLESDSIAHPALEAVFTVCEEVGLDGASGLDVGMIEGRRLINIDSEEDYNLVVGCAGGATLRASIPLHRKKIEGVRYVLEVSGLTGGHSGQEIDKGGANANVIMGRILSSLQTDKLPALISIHGGTKNNVIPTACNAEFIVSEHDAHIIENIMPSLSDVIASEYAVSDPDFTVRLACHGKATAEAFNEETVRKILLTLNMVPNGVQAMSQNIKGLVETSLNLGVLSCTRREVTYEYSLRSGEASALTCLIGKITTFIKYLNGNVTVSGRYPAWKFRDDSPLRELAKAKYHELTGKDYNILTIHAGLECGILCDRIPEMDAISIGPNLYNVHTVKEHLSISSTQLVWNLLLEILKSKS